MFHVKARPDGAALLSGMTSQHPAAPCRAANTCLHDAAFVFDFSILLSTGLKEVFPVIYTALRIALTLPVSSASPERAFTKLKLIKTRLKSTMCEERLESLMLISCEKDIAINTDEVIKTFSSYSFVLRKLLL
jgi:hypothetical protein